MVNKEHTRLNKYISMKGICSRREADKFIEQGHVSINGRRAKVGDQVKPGDRIVVNGQALEEAAEEFILIAFNKPVGITCTTESNTKNNIVDYVNHSARIFPIGRLDKDSQGLIFLTSNGDIVNKILRAGNKHEKEYLVTVNKPISESFINNMAAGVPILGETTKKCKVTQESPFIFKIILVQGMNRQIRRMCEYFNYEVVKLERTRIMNITLKGLPLGEWRQLEDVELQSLLKSTEKSISTTSRSQAIKTLVKLKEKGNKNKNSPTKMANNNPDLRNLKKANGRPAKKESISKRPNRINDKKKRPSKNRKV